MIDPATAVLIHGLEMEVTEDRTLVLLRFTDTNGKACAIAVPAEGGMDRLQLALAQLDSSMRVAPVMETPEPEGQPITGAVEQVPLLQLVDSFACKRMNEVVVLDVHTDQGRARYGMDRKTAQDLSVELAAQSTQDSSSRRFDA